MTWADLDKVAIKPRPDGSTLIVLQDGRTGTQIAEVRLVSILVAMCRVARAREALAQKFDGKGSVYYVVAGQPPGFLVEAVTSAGGVVFDGKREHTMPSPMVATMLLDSTLCDLATAVRRRVNVRTFRDALEVREHELQRKPVPRADSAAWWTTVFELIALAGELFRAEEPGKWQLVGSARPPLGLQQPRKKMAFPGELASAIADGGVASLRTLVELSKPRAPSEPLATSLRAMPMLVHRRAVPIETLTWETLVPDETDHDDLPVITYVEDRDDSVFWPTHLGPPTPQLRTRALSNLARTEFSLQTLEVMETRLVLVLHEDYGCEAVLHRPTMQRIETMLASDSLVLGFPERGHMIAMSSIVSDDDLLHFLQLVEKRFLDAAERARVASDAVFYSMGKPLGRVQSNLMDTRRALRRMGIDPDA